MYHRRVGRRGSVLLDVPFPSPIGRMMIRAEIGGLTSLFIDPVLLFVVSHSLPLRFDRDISLVSNVASYFAI